MSTPKKTSSSKRPSDPEGPGSASAYPAAISQPSTQLANQFLLAMPGMLDEQFAGSVVYLFEHNDKGGQHTQAQ